MGVSPGWYDDGHGSVRYWDGSQWTAHTAATAVLSDDADKRRRRIGLIVMAAVGVVTAAGLVLAGILVWGEREAPSAQVSSTESATPAATESSHSDAATVVKAFVRAWASGDCATEWELATREWTLADSAADYCAGDGAGVTSKGFVDVRVELTEIDGDAGSVTTAETYDAAGTGVFTVERWAYSVTLTADGWKVVATRFVE